jgi:hypothetical protein
MGLELEQLKLAANWLRGRHESQKHGQLHDAQTTDIITDE